MSRIGKKSIKVPEGVDVKIDGQKIVVKGPKGELKREFPEVLSIKIQDGLAVVTLRDNDQKKFRLWGLGRALLADMIKGVSEGFEKVLEFSGIGFKAQVQNNCLELNVGFTNPVVIKAPPGITFEVEKGIIRVKGIDKELVGQTAALIRASRPPEPYKGTGIKYKEEILIRKAGKKAVAAG